MVPGLDVFQVTWYVETIVVDWLTVDLAAMLLVGGEGWWSDVEGGTNWLSVGGGKGWDWRSGVATNWLSESSHVGWLRNKKKERDM